MSERPANVPLRLVVFRDDVVRRVLAIGQAPLSVGRDAENALVLEDGKVSRQHCRLLPERDRLWIEDCRSVNGTLVNGRAVERAALAPGDQIEIGPFRLVLEELPVEARGSDSPTEEHARPVQRAGPQAQELAVLLSLLESLNLELPRPDLLARVLGAVLSALDGERAFLFAYRAKGQALSRLHQHLRDGADAALPVSDKLLRGVVASREPALFTDLIGEVDRESPSILALGKGPVQSIVVAPLLRGRMLVGVLYVDGRLGRRSFSTGDLDLLNRASAYLAGVLAVWRQQDVLVEENHKLKQLAQVRRPREVPVDRLHAPGSPYARALELLRRAAASDVSVLVTGETGTGKEEAARLVHRTSARAAGPFIAINCGAIAEGLVESELFGYRKGAFSGAAEDRAGLIELAHGGTLFLDEVGELPAAVQVRLLRVLEERQVQRLGASEPVEVDFRLVTATHRDLEDAVKRGAFRQDLLYRLAVFPVVLPALRERAMDLPLLVDYLIEALAARAGRPPPTAAPDLIGTLARYDWPGNIRELRNVLERALVLSDDAVLGPTALPLELLQTSRAAESAPEDAAPEGLDTYAAEIRAFERDYFKRLRKRVGSNISAMARASGISRFTLYRKLGDIGLDGD